MTGEEKLKETAERLKKNTKNDELAMASAKSALEKTRAMLQANPELMSHMQEDARDESEKLGGSLPFLKLYVTNKSRQLLADGSEPTNGYFYYVPTKEQYKEVHCHILHISRGFRMPGMANESGDAKPKWNHIVSGIMLNDEPKPFWLFISGQARLAKLWEFQKGLRNFVQAGIPSFPLIVKLTSGKGPEPKAGKSQAMVVNFEVEENEDGQPQMVTNNEEYMALRKKVHELEVYVEAYILKKEVPEVEKPEHVESETVKPDEIPF